MFFATIKKGLYSHSIYTYEYVIAKKMNPSNRMPNFTKTCCLPHTHTHKVPIGSSIFGNKYLQIARRFTIAGGDSLHNTQQTVHSINIHFSPPHRVRCTHHYLFIDFHLLNGIWTSSSYQSGYKSKYNTKRLWYACTIPYTYEADRPKCAFHPQQKNQTKLYLLNNIA